MTAVKDGMEWELRQVGVMRGDEMGGSAGMARDGSDTGQRMETKSVGKAGNVISIPVQDNVKLLSRYHTDTNHHHLRP